MSKKDYKFDAARKKQQKIKNIKKHQMDTENTNPSPDS
jgi:hypothetical protein